VGRAPARAELCGELGEAFAAEVMAREELSVGWVELAERATEQIAERCVRLWILGHGEGIRDGFHIELFVFVTEEPAPVGGVVFRDFEQPSLCVQRVRGDLGAPAVNDEKHLLHEVVERDAVHAEMVQLRSNGLRVCPVQGLYAAHYAPSRRSSAAAPWAAFSLLQHVLRTRRRVPPKIRGGKPWRPSTIARWATAFG
jgi:hypothetical protein